MKAGLLVWLVPTFVLFLLCSFTQLTMDMTDWSAICRGVFGVGVVGFGIFALVALNNTK